MNIKLLYGSDGQGLQAMYVYECVLHYEPGQVTLATEHKEH